MTILFAIKKMDDAAGGAERVLAAVMNGLVARGWTIALLSFDRPGGTSFYPLDPRIQRIYVPVGDAAKKSGIAETCARMRDVRARILEIRPRAVVGFMHSMFIPLGFALWRSGIPVIASDHMDPRYYRRRIFEYILLCLSVLAARRFVVVSPSVRKFYPGILQDRTDVIPNSVTPVPARANPAGENTARKLILNVGRLHEEKGQDILIDAFARLAADYPDWDLRLVGEGPLRPALEAQIKKLKLDERVSLPGTVRDVATEYARAHIFAVPSRYESFGLAMAEAMSAGLPAVGFDDCPGTRDLVTPRKNGLLAAGGSALALAVQLRTLMDSPSLRTELGAAGPSSVVGCDSESVLALWENILRRVSST